VINDVLGVPPDDRDWLGAALAVLNRGFASQRPHRGPADALLLHRAALICGVTSCRFSSLPTSRIIPARDGHKFLSLGRARPPGLGSHPRPGL
jgi:hypothetical protein